MTATKIALQTATEARRAAEATGNAAEIAAASVAELGAYLADFDARHPAECTETTCEAAEKTHRVITNRTWRPCCKACRAAHFARKLATPGLARPVYAQARRVLRELGA